MNFLGGERIILINKEASNEAQRPIYDTHRSFEEKDKFNNFHDFTVTYRINKKNYSSIWALQLKNVLGNSQYDGYQYNYNSQQLKRQKNVFTMPVFSYKVEF